MREEEISLGYIFSAILRKLWIIILSLILGAVLLFGYSKLFVAPTYTTNVYMTILNIKQDEIKDYMMSTSIIEASKALAKSVVEIIPNSPVYSEIAESLGVSESTVASAVSIRNNEETFVIRINVTTSNKQLTSDIAAKLAEYLPPYMREINMGSVGLVNNPREPSVADSWKRYSLIGAVAGAFVSVGFILLFALLDRTVKHEEDLANYVEYPVLSEIPSLCGKKKKMSPITSLIPKLRKKFLAKESKLRASGRDLISKDTKFTIVENYRQLRTNLLFATSVTDKNVVIVSSGQPNEGKSTTACNIAISLAQDNKKVLLIEADMRKPTIHKKMALDNVLGLSSILSDKKDVKECTHENVYENLDVITSGILPPNPTELLSSETMEKFLNEVSAKYDYVIVDTPPVEIVADTRAFAQHTAGVVVVARQDITTYDEVVRTVKMITNTNAKVLGIVIIDVEIGKKHYSRYYKYSYIYRRYGGYGANNEYYAEQHQKKGIDLKDDD